MSFLRKQLSLCMANGAHLRNSIRHFVAVVIKKTAREMNTCESKTILRLASPIGQMNVIVCQNGLHAMSQLDGITDANFEPNNSIHVALLDELPQDELVKKHLLQCIKWLETYFCDAQASTHKDLPKICVASETGKFRERVWLALAKNIGPGQTISYGQLAKLVNSPGAAQAAGTAMATNPLQILVPCHRVIRNDGSMGLYARGCKNKVKLWLLEHEGVNIKSTGK